MPGLKDQNSSYKIWLLKSRQDLKAAKRLTQDDDELLDMAIYHAQQTVEKAFKAYLVFNNQVVYKTHDLEKLVSQCIQIDQQFEVFLQPVIFLTPFGTKLRYPDDYVFPDKKDLIQAIIEAEKILRFIVYLLDDSLGENLRIF